MCEIQLKQKISMIKDKLDMLKRCDRKLRVFGASTHKYQINEPLNEKDIKEFEDEYLITLPDEYRCFLLEVGDGGAGPYYGLQTLNDSLFEDLDYKRPGEYVNPSIQFPHLAAWNMEFEGDYEDDVAYQEFEEEYFSDKWITGVLRLCNYGCGISMNLVVNGDEKGNIWVDDRGNDGGIYPDPYFEQTERTSFLNWYNLWLDASLKEIKSKPKWKFW